MSGEADLQEDRTTTGIKRVAQGRNPALAVAFLGLLLVQGWHEVEHVVQVLQRFVFSIPTGSGVLGQTFDVEPLHLAYNLAFFCLILLVYRLSGTLRPGLWQRGMIAWWLLTIVVAFQGYHVVEHLFKVAQFINTGKNGTPGILGNFFNLVWLHFTFNTVEYLLLVAAFWLGGFYRHFGTDLRAAWQQLSGQRSYGPPATGKPTL